jgi:hypothetical protein
LGGPADAPPERRGAADALLTALGVAPKLAAGAPVRARLDVLPELLAGVHRSARIRGGRPN